MRHEISQLDIPHRQLLASNAQPIVWTEIGEAQITHTIFGRAKVRIIRKNDNYRRGVWLTGMVAAAIAAAAWQGLFTSQPSESLQSADLPPPVSVREQPAFQFENIASPSIPPAAMKESVAPQPTEGLNSPEPKAALPAVTHPKPVTIQQKPIETQAKPVTPQPLAASKPQTAPLVANSSSRSPINAQPPAQSLPLKPIVAPAVSTLPATKPVAEPAASSQAAVLQMSDPLLKADTSTPAPQSVQSK